MESAKSKLILNQAYNLLKYTFGIMPMVAGLDKFTNIITDWSQYLHPGMVDMLPFSAGAFMMIVGAIEFVAGILVITKTEIGGYVVAGWLALIAATLITGLNFVDVAIRDLVMAVAAFSMARMSKIAD